MNLVINRAELYGSDAHENFFVGWPTKPSYKLVKSHFANAESIFAIQGDEITGFITALTDKSLFAFIPLLEVRPEFQHRGIGTSLVSAMELHLGELYGIDLVCDPDLISFYKTHGFLELSGMVKRNPKVL
jgi:ribosomal protein S18 acetylase RimI-like enzyme